MSPLTRLLSFAPLFVTAPALAAQDVAATGSVAGRVADERGQPLAGADVSLVGRAGVTARSAANGTYVLEGAPAGAARLQVRLIGYRTQTAEVQIAAGQRATQD